MDTHAGSSFKQLQAHLSDARISLKAGEFDAALDQVDRALEIDPEYLAARALREKISSAKLAPPAAGMADIESSVQEPNAPVSIESFAKFEERARHRRVEHRLQSARAAIRAGQLGEARAALGELSALDPELSDLAPITLELAEAERAVRIIPSRGPLFAAGVTFAVLLIGASWFETDSIIAKRSHQPIPAAPAFQGHAGVIDPLAPALPSPAAPVTAAAVDASAPYAEEAVPRSPSIAPATDSVPAAAPAATPVAPIGVPVPPPPLPVSVPPAVTPLVRPLQPADIEQQPVAVAAPDEDRLVRETLQRYRNAYEVLNARSAQDVWPTVDEPALARAFDGLESQSLTFDDCAVQLHGAIATATCRGSARYTPRAGSREPHVEPRVWNFTLRKTSTVWEIDSARVGR